MSPRRSLKNILTRQFYTWHWVSSAICLTGMLLFSVTGLTLNHADSIAAKPVTVEKTHQLEGAHLEAVRPVEGREESGPLPAALAAHLSSVLDLKVRHQKAEWSEDEIYVSLPRPGGDAWISIDRESGEVLSERTSRGMISFFNDLHKGRHTGTAWSWFIDIFSVASVIFTLTGLGLLWVHARRRPSTWPIVLAGAVLPAVLIIFFLH